MIENFAPCRKCRGNGKTIPQGFYRDYQIKNELKVPILVECIHHKEWRSKKNLYNKFINNGFDKKLFNIEAKITHVNLINYINNFSNNEDMRSISLYFFGTTDTQKTVTATYIAKKLIDSNYDVKYIRCADLFEKIMDDQFRDDDSTDKYLNCDLLIIDDFFKEEYSDKQISFLLKFIEKRIDNNKGIIFISQKSIRDIKNETIKSLLIKYIFKYKYEFAFHNIFNDIPKSIFDE